MTKKKMALLCIIIIFTMMGYGTVIPLNNYFVDILNFSSLQVGLLISLYALGQLISAPIIGGVVDEVGNKKSILVSFILYISSFIITFTFSSKFIILLFRFFSGVCAGIITLTIENYIGNNVKEEQKVQYFTYSSFSIGIGMVIGPLLGIALLYSKIILLFIFILSVIVTLLLLKVLNEDIKFEKKHNVLLGLKDSFVVAIKSKLNIYILFVFMIFGIITSSLESKIVLFISENYVFSELSLGLFLISCIAILIYTLVIHQRVGAKIEKLKYSLFMVLVSAISLFTIYISGDNINILCIGFMLLIIALSSLISTLTSLITSLKTKTGILLGLRNTFLFIGMIIGPVVTALLYDYNTHIIFFTLSILCLAMFVYGEIQINDNKIEYTGENKNEK